jgi:hypothetical protein
MEAIRYMKVYRGRRAVAPGFDPRRWLDLRGSVEAICEPAGHGNRDLGEGHQLQQELLAEPEGQPITIEFTNNDAGIPHDVAICTAENDD